VVELVITGSPAGKADVLDDASQDAVLNLQDEDEPLSALLERHNAYYRSAWVTRQPGLLLPQEDEVPHAGEVVDLLAKVLLYLNLAEAERVPTTERSDLERRLRGLGPKKAKLLARQLSSAYDRILIGSRIQTQMETSTADAEPSSGEAPSHHLRPHPWRGHFRRNRYGDGSSESRLGWMQPVLVNAADALGRVQTTAYAPR
jgi:hypothetical protein